MNDETDRIEGLERLARRRAPARDLWPGIASRLKPRRSRWPGAQLALAASVVAGFAAVFAVTLVRTPGGAAATVAAAPAALTSDSRAIVKANVSLVEQAERQLRRALEESPESKRLRDMLARAENRQRALRAML